MTDKAKLYDLQKIDIAWHQVRRRLLQIKELVGESEVLTSSRQQVEATAAELHQKQAQQKDAELESQTLAQRIQESNARLMGGKVRNPKELESLQASIDALGRQRAMVDDAAVEALLEAEELSENLTALQGTFSGIEAEWQAEQRALQQEEGQLKRKFLLLKQRREASAKSLSASLLKQYESLRKRKNGVAIAAVTGDTCGACHMQLPTGVSTSARVSTHAELVYCPSCGRILYGN